VVLAVEQEDQHWVEASLLRRLVALEVSDIEMPELRPTRARSKGQSDTGDGKNAARPVATDSADTKSGRDKVFVRVRRKDSRVLVELWYRGEFGGQRQLSSASGPQVIARRIALAAGELARRLRDYRVASLQRGRKKQSKAEQLQRRGLPIYALPNLAPALVLSRTGGDWWFIGPELMIGLSANNGARLALSFAAFAVSPLKAEGALAEWFEMGLRPGYDVRLTPASHLSFNLDATLASFHAFGSAFPKRQDALVPRVGADVRVLYQLSRQVEFNVGINAGLLLRQLSFGDVPSLGREWLGLRLGVSLTPTGAW
jgi:hypothetical protein